MIEYIHVFNFVVSLLCVIIAHELGHILYGKYILKRDFKIKWGPDTNWNIHIGEPKDYQGLNKNDMAGLAFCGMVAGFFPFYFIENVYIYLAVLGVYIMGIKNDMVIFCDFVREQIKHEGFS